MLNHIFKKKKKRDGKRLLGRNCTEKGLEVEKKEARLVGRGRFIVKLMKLKFQNLSFALPLSRLGT